MTEDRVVPLVRTPETPFDHIEAGRVLFDALWAIEQSANGHAKDINWLPIRDRMKDLSQHFMPMTCSYVVSLDEKEAASHG